VAMLRLLLASLLIVAAFSQSCSRSPDAVDSVPGSPTISYSRPQPLSSYSQLVDVYKMGPDFDPNPRSNCPHLQANLLDWHDPSIWPSGVPQAGSDVVLPAGKILVSSCSWPVDGFNKITIPAGSELIFADAPMQLRVRNVLVQGAFRMGSPTCRLFSNIVINFYGDEGSQQISEITSGLGTKGIVVFGEIDIHGKQFHPTWTRLAATAAAGSSIVFLQDATNWEVGQQVVFATSAFLDAAESTHQNEVRTIVAIDRDVLQLDSPLKYSHYAGEEYQSEVGLLSRRIQINGNPVGTFGGHILITGKGRVSGVRLNGMGQQNRMARYPLHFHRANECPDCYFKDNSVVDSMFRCFTIHATNSTSVARNVAYNIFGSCYYIEDGIEEKNSFVYNLAIRIKTIGTPAAGETQLGDEFVQDSSAVQPADHAAGCYYITNSYNVFLGNAASGGWTGYSFITVNTPLGPSAGFNPAVPSSRPVLLFEGNTGHSAGESWVTGSCMYTGGRIWEDSTPTVTHYDSGRGNRPGRNQEDNKHHTTLNGVDTWSVFKNTRLWLCRVGVTFWGSRGTFDGLEITDSALGGIAFDQSTFKRVFFNADSGNSEYGWRYDPNWDTTLAFQYYDTSTPIILSDVTFKNYQPQAAHPNRKYYALSSMTHSDVFKPQGINAVTKAKFVNTPIPYRLYNQIDGSITGSYRYFTLLDGDGSFSADVSSNNPTGTKLIGTSGGSTWWQYRNDCVLSGDWNAYICPKSDNTIEVATVKPLTDGKIPGYGDNTAMVAKMIYFGPGQDGSRWTTVTGNPGVTGLTGVAGWYYYPLDESLPQKLTIDINQIPRLRSIIFAARYPGGTTFQISRQYPWTTGANFISGSYDQMFNSDGTIYYFDGTHLYIKLVSAKTEEAFYAYGGVKINLEDYGFTYTITASCNPCWSGYALPYQQNVVPPLLPGLFSTTDTMVVRPNYEAVYTNIAQLSSRSAAPMDCVVSNWTCGIQCSSLCGAGSVQCTRQVEVPSLYGGRSCPGLTRRCACYTACPAVPSNYVLQTRSITPSAVLGVNKETITVQIDYMANQNSRIDLTLMQTGTWAWYGSTSGTVNAGWGTVTLQLTTTGGLAQTNVQFKAEIFDVATNTPRSEVWTTLIVGSLPVADVPLTVTDCTIPEAVPVVEPVPVPVDPVPVWVAPVPVYVAPVPVYVAPVPVYVAPVPVYVAPVPVPVWAPDSLQYTYIPNPVPGRAGSKFTLSLNYNVNQVSYLHIDVHQWGTWIRFGSSGENQYITLQPGSGSLNVPVYVFTSGDMSNDQMKAKAWVVPLTKVQSNPDNFWQDATAEAWGDLNVAPWIYSNALADSTQTYSQTQNEQQDSDMGMWLGIGVAIGVCVTALIVLSIFLVRRSTKSSVEERA